MAVLFEWGSFKSNHFSMTNIVDSMGKGAKDGGVSALKCISIYMKWAFSAAEDDW